MTAKATGIKYTFMKSGNLFKCILAVGVCTAFAGCDGKEENAPAGPKITKTVLDVLSESPEGSRAGWEGGGMVWHADDRIGVFTETDANVEFVRTAADTEPGTASFEGILTGPDRESDVYSYYPYSADAECEGGLLVLTAPETQTYVAEGFGGLPMVAYHRGIPGNASLLFKNLYAVIALRLSTEPQTAGKLILEQVIFEGKGGEALSGRITADPTSGEPQAGFADAGGKRLVLDCTAGPALALGTEPVTVHIAVPAIDYPQGYRFTFVTNRGDIVRTAAKAGAVHRRNVIYPVPELILPDPAAVIPDPLFRKELVRLGYITETDDEGRVNITEKGAQVTQMDIGFIGIASLKGIEYFPKLEELICSENSLSELDLSGNPAVTTLLCDYNELESLNISACTNMYELDCSHNSLTELKGMPSSLTALNCSYNDLTGLEIKNLAALNSLSCQNNKLSVLEVPDNRVVTIIRCGNNSMEKLNVSGCISLSSLYCENNPLRTLDISGTPKLNRIYFAAGINAVNAGTFAIPSATGLKEVIADDYAAYPSSGYAWTAVTCNSNPTIERISLRYRNSLSSVTATGNPSLAVIDLTGSPGCTVTQSGNGPAIEIIR